MQNTQIKLEDFKIVSVVEQTHQQTTTIHLAKLNGKLVVLKAMKKSYFSDAKRIEHLQNEREVLEYFTKEKVVNVNHLISTFKDEDNVYFVLEPAFGLPLHKLMKMAETFDPLFVGMIITQIGLILQDFHERGFIYRDIKLSNFVIDGKGKVVMLDLGKAKRTNGQRTMTLCGTTHAIPPQILLGEGKFAYSYQFDYYAFGILLYQLLAGKAPFGYQGSNPNIKEDIENGLMPEHLEQLADDTAADLITKLLNPPEHRLGKQKGFKQILSHPYFRKIDFEQIMKIMNGDSGSQAMKYSFKQYQSEIQDFGIDAERYQDIQPDDPFYNF